MRIPGLYSAPRCNMISGRNQVRHRRVRLCSRRQERAQADCTFVFYRGMAIFDSFHFIEANGFTYLSALNSDTVRSMHFPNELSGFTLFPVIADQGVRTGHRRGSHNMQSPQWLQALRNQDIQSVAGSARSRRGHGGLYGQAWRAVLPPMSRGDVVSDRRALYCGPQRPQPQYRYGHRSD